MRRRVRKFVGAVAMLAFVCVYAVLAMLVAQADGVRNANAAVQAVFFLVVGLAWILPLMPLIRWMERPDDPGLPANR
jgi:predicted membrane channel-forming protein YqfA (hemolysin III family)